MKIIKAKYEDLQSILKLQMLAYQSEAELLNNYDIPPLKQTISEIEKEFENGIILKAANDGGKIIGSVRAYQKDDTVYIGKLIVHPEHQKKGIGTALLHEIEIVCPSARYELFISNKSKNNLRLYEKLGYKSFKEQSITQELKFIFLDKKSIK